MYLPTMLHASLNEIGITSSYIVSSLLWVMIRPTWHNEIDNVGSKYQVQNHPNNTQVAKFS